MNKRTSISEIGEFGLIERIKEKCRSLNLPENITDRIVLGIDDDTSVTHPPKDMLELSTSDMLIEGVHFDLTYTSMRHLGWKLMVANLSDIASMGGKPVYALISVALPAKVTVEMVDDLYEGILQAAQTYTCAVLGGDTNTSFGNMILSATVQGEVQERFLKLRGGARTGDKICISGNLGLSHAGLRILQREKARFKQTESPEEFSPRLDDYKEAVIKHLAPKARFDISTIIAEKEWAHAMVDISDGLASDLRHICRQSGAGALLFEDKIKHHPAVVKIAEEFSDSPLDYILFGGEEYELLFTIDPGFEHELKKLLPDVMVIGDITDEDGKITVARRDGSKFPVLPGGYDHFRKS